MRTAPVFSKEKLIFLKKRYLETILGGYKLNIDDEKLSIFDHFFQIFFYISPIVISIILGILIDDYYLSINIVAGINTLLNMILMLTLHCITVKKSKKTVPEEYQNIKLELLYKNKSYIEFIITLILTYAFFYLSTSNIYNIYRNDTDFIVKIVLSGVVMLISSFSLFVSQPLEISINPMDLNYNRPIYNICILIIKILFDFYLDQYSYIILIVYFLEIYGFLSGVLAEISSLFFWSIEYINLVLFGDSIKATNLRLLLGFCYNISVCILSSLIFLSEIKNIYKLVINIILLTFFNFCGLNNLFFELNLENKEFKEKNFKWNFSFFRQIFGFIIYIVSILALFFGVNEIFIENITIEYKNYIIAIGVIVLTNGILGYFVYLFQNEIIFRIFIGLGLSLGKYINQIIKLILNISINLFIIGIIMPFILTKSEENWDFQNFFLYSILIYRSFRLNDLYWPQIFFELFESFIFIIIISDNNDELYNTLHNILYYAPIFQLINMFISNFTNRFIIYIYSLYQIHTVKSLKLKHSKLFTILSLTLFFPINFIQILLSCILNIPLLQLFGLPIFILGPLKPQNQLNSINFSIKPCLEGHLYKILFKGSCIAIHDLLEKEVLNFKFNDFYLIRCNKYVIILNILEKSCNYSVIGVRGLELQEITSCHNLEAQEIDNNIKEIFEKNNRIYKNCFTILEPFKKININCYDDNSIKLTGLIENSNFSIGLKQIYMKTLIFLLINLENIDKKSEIDEFSKELPSDLLISNLYNLFPNDWFEFLAKEEIRSPIIKSPITKIDSPDLIVKIEAKPQNSNFFGLFDDLEEIGLIGEEQKLIKNENIINTEIKKIQKNPEKSSYKHKFIDFILYFFGYSLNQRDENLSLRLTNEQIFDLFKEAGQLKKKKISGNSYDFMINLCKKAFRIAFKISLDIQVLDGIFELNFNDLITSIKEIENKWFIGLDTEKEMLESIDNKKEFIMCLQINSDRELNLYRASIQDLNAYIFKLNSDIIKGIWSNLRLELLYATNNDEERYSIQSHPNYLRNLIIQSSNEPLGYAPFYSGPISIII